MSRRVRIGRFALVTLLAVMLVAPQAAVALDPGVYEHIWQAQTFFSGVAGTSDQFVLESSVEMNRDAGAFEGSVLFSDLLGVETDSKVTSQESRIELALTGTTQQGWEAAGGTFTGEAVLTLRDVATLAEAVDESVLEIDAEPVTYEVSGHWGGTVEGEVIEGEILFERIEGPAQPASGPEYFNRANAANPDMLGDAQRFAVDLSAAPGSGDTAGDGSGTDGATTEGDSDNGGNSDSDGRASTTDTGVFGYILKGLTGGAEKPVMPVPDELAALARALADASPVGATPLPDDAIAIDVDLSGSYLDAKNRVSLLAAADGSMRVLAPSLVAEVEEMRRAVPGVLAVPVDEDAATAWVGRAQALLDSQADIEGVSALAEQIGLVRPGAGSNAVSAIRTWYHVAAAVGAQGAFGSTLGSSAELAEDVARTEIPPGPGADAVLAAANSPSAPSSARIVTEFERMGVTSTAPLYRSLPAQTLAAHGTESDGGLSLTYMTVDGPQRVAPGEWIAYWRNDDTAFWLAGEDGDVALTDGSLRGWAFGLERAALVDAQHVGIWLAVYPIR